MSLNTSTSTSKAIFVSHWTADDKAKMLANALKRKPGFALAKAIARASADDRANVVAVLGPDYIFSVFFEPELPL
jgi:hypothetical protein